MLSKREIIEEYAKAKLPEFGYQNVHTPYSLCNDIVSKLAEYTDPQSCSILVLFNVEWLPVLVEDFGVDSSRITFVADSAKKRKLAQLYNVGIDHKLSIVGRKEIKIMPKVKKQFDVVLANPPYQAPTARSKKGRGGGSGTTLWDRFVPLFFDLAKEDGFVAIVHPSGWREAFGSFSDVKDVLANKQVKFLELHNRDDGFSIFGSYTSYDWYAAQNRQPSAPAVVRQRSGVECHVNLSDFPFIPNDDIAEISRLFATEGEATVEVLYSRGMYGSDKPHMSREKKGKFRHPCAYTVSMNNELNLMWSSTRKNGHFGVPKIIFSNGTSGTILDKTGEFGLTEFSYGIVDTPANLRKIQKAITSPAFLEIMANCSLLGKHRYNRKAISVFRKDFWKEFV